MNIRKTTMDDLPEVMKIYEAARRFMSEHGNPTQWGKGRPSKEQIEQDIVNGNSYVCEENEKIAATFAFIIGKDPTYQVIEQGSWHSGETYGTIHRIASDGTVRGVTKACFDYCSSKIPYLRIDTHKDNEPMQNAIKKYGFRECGIIHVADGSERIAFDYSAINMFYKQIIL